MSSLMLTESFIVEYVQVSHYFLSIKYFIIICFYCILKLECLTTDNEHYNNEQIKINNKTKTFSYN